MQRNSTYNRMLPAIYLKTIYEIEVKAGDTLPQKWELLDTMVRGLYATPTPRIK